jgi:hypothetical protein
MAHLATVRAFPNKFGSYTGAVVPVGGEAIKERFPTYDEAKNWARAQAWDRFKPCRFSYIAGRGRENYISNIWSA